MATFNIDTNYFNDATSYIDIKAGVYSILPLDSEYTWDDSYEETIRQEVANRIGKLVRNTMSTYTDTTHADKYTVDTNSDEDSEEVVWQLTANDFTTEVSYSDNGYYGAEIEITVYNNFSERAEQEGIDVWSEAELLNEAAHWLVEQTETAQFQEALQECFNDACEETFDLLQPLDEEVA